MIRVALETKQNELVVNGMIPPFNELPEVIGWGDRVFKLTAPHTSSETAAIYTEVFAVALVQTLGGTYEVPPDLTKKKFLDGDERRNGVRS